MNAAQTAYFEGQLSTVRFLRRAFPDSRWDETRAIREDWLRDRLTEAYITRDLCTLRLVS